MTAFNQQCRNPKCHKLRRGPRQHLTPECFTQTEHSSLSPHKEQTPSALNPIGLSLSDPPCGSPQSQTPASCDVAACRHPCLSVYTQCLRGDTANVRMCKLHTLAQHHGTHITTYTHKYKPLWTYTQPHTHVQTHMYIHPSTHIHTHTNIHAPLQTHPHIYILIHSYTSQWIYAL